MRDEGVFTHVCIYGQLLGALSNIIATLCSESPASTRHQQQHTAVLGCGCCKWIRLVVGMCVSTQRLHGVHVHASDLQRPAKQSPQR